MEQNEQIIQVRPFNMRATCQMRDLDPKHIDKLITMKGIVIRTSDTVPEMKEACYKCSKCRKEEYKFIERGKITEPEFCDGCRNRQTFELMHNQCMFSDKQYIKIQEIPESVPEGETPQTVLMCAYEDLVDFVKPGDRCEIVGIYRASGIRVNNAMRTLKNVYKTYIDVIGFVKSDSKRYENAEEKEKQPDDNEPMNEEDMDQALNQEHDSHFTEEQVKKYRDFSKDPQMYDLLVDAFAPSIWENQDVKKGILCQLFGGCSKQFAGSGRGRFRGEINVLLCGDPSTAKSQLL